MVAVQVSKRIDRSQYATVDERGKKIKYARRTKKLSRSVGGTVALFIFIGIFAIFMVMPMVLTVSNAFKPLDELFYFPPRFFVRNPTPTNFSDLFILMQQSWVPFSRYILNSLIITGFGTVGHLLFASAAAYPLAKNRFPGSKFLMSIVVLSLMFSPVVTAIPNFFIMTQLNLIDNQLAIILPAFSASLGLYLMKQFMEQIPDSLIESARIDGCWEVGIWWKIVMPNVKPAWLTLIILMFQALWANTGGTFIHSEELKPMTFAMNQIAAGGIARAGTGAAVMFITMIVPVTFFVISQSRIVETMATSGMKE
ncbi:MAG: carbohydrate ABC transporter permease [Defluviitaleaceae bacterium]|nr:carbohydrate ABC transporter permease [Defluviitaleaceae bacterium]MCL2240269.1 carbohydrate ABC transporter permease [Defluviitaleaceae bacterium]